MDKATATRALQARMLEYIPLARHMGARIDTADAQGLVLRAPFAENSNHKGTAFGGSLYCVAVLAGWGLLALALVEHDVDAEVVIQDAHVEYLLPVTGDFSARAASLEPRRIAKCLRTLARYGRARLQVNVTIEQAGIEAVRLRGSYVLQTT